MSKQPLYQYDFNLMQMYINYYRSCYVLEKFLHADQHQVDDTIFQEHSFAVAIC